MFAYQAHAFAKSWKNDFGHLNDEEVLDKKKVIEDIKPNTIDEKNQVLVLNS